MKNRYSKNSATLVGSILKGALKKRHLTGELEKYEAFPLWEEIVGADIAKIATPEKISRGNVLVVRVLDSIYAQELTLQKTRLLDLLHQAAVGASIQDIKFVAGNPTDFKGKK